MSRSAAAEFANDEDLSKLEKLAHDGVNRNGEAEQLITQSQELFAQGKPTEALQLLRKAYELDKKNSLARSILANALVEHAQSIVETDWLEAEKLANQALNLNPAHPTAKRILNQIVGKKETSPVSEWVAQARKLQSSGDLFAALAWVAEGLAVHPHEPKLLQIQDEIQRDQEARRRQARRGDLEDLRRMQKEIEATADIAAKQVLAERIQAVAAKHWTDGEILSIANALLLRLGLVGQDNSGGTTRSKGAALILHVPRPTASKAPPAATSQVGPSPAQASEAEPGRTPRSPIPASQAAQTPAPPTPVAARPEPAGPDLGSPDVASPALPSPLPSASVPTFPDRANKIHPERASQSNLPAKTTQQGKIERSAAEPKAASPQTPAAAAAESSVRAAKVISPLPVERPPRSNVAMLALIAAAAVTLVAVTFYFTRRHYAAPAAKSPEPAPAVSGPAVSAAPVSAPVVSAPAATTEQSLPASTLSADATAGKITAEDRSPVVAPSEVQPSSAHSGAESLQSAGSLLVITGQDGARVLLNGKLLPQLTQAGQMRLPHLDLKEYVVQVSKAGFQDPPAQKIRIRNAEQAKLIFNLQPLARMASLFIRGADPGTAVLIDQALVGTVQPDGTLSVSTVTPGDHTIELHKDRFKPRQLKKRFVVGETISLAAADAALEAAPAELKISFSPADATVAISKGDLPTVVRSGVPLNLAAGTYTLTARTADGFTRFSTFAVVGGQSRTLDLSLTPNGMPKWDDPGAWKKEGESFIRKGGGFVLYGVSPASGTFAFSVMLSKGHLLQWVINYADAKNYVLFQMDDKNFYRTVIRNGEKTDQIIVPYKGDKKSVRVLRIRVSPTELVNQIQQGSSWTVLDRLTQPGANLSLGKFGFYLPGDDQIVLSSFAHYADLNIR